MTDTRDESWLDVDDVCPLNQAENNLLQVLLSEFRLGRVSESAQLRLRFDWQWPTIRRREGKDSIEEEMRRRFESKRRDFERYRDDLQTTLEGILLEARSDTLHHNNPDFVFRYANGGALPIIQLDGQQYYALFLRDTKPHGWNIANGASDTIEELSNPIMTVERELCEELIVLDFNQRQNYNFAWDNRTVHRPEFDVARKLWDSYFDQFNIAEFQRKPLEVRWEHGPDQITIDSALGRKTEPGGFLNINATDFGIEFDKLATISIERDARLLDGEISRNQLLDRPIGLFRVDRFSDKIAKDDQFLPDRFFYTGTPYSGGDLHEVVDDFLEELVKKEIRDSEAKKEYLAKSDKFRLCPVTRQIIIRHHRRRPPDVHPVMLSYARADSTADALVEILEERGVRVWRDTESIPGGAAWREAIVAGIDGCDVVLFLVSRNSMKSEHVKQELQLASSQNKTILPVRIDDGPVSEPTIRLMLAGVQYTDMSSGIDERKIRQLLDDLAAHGVQPRR